MLLKIFRIKIIQFILSLSLRTILYLSMCMRALLTVLLQNKLLHASDLLNVFFSLFILGINMKININ